MQSELVGFLQVECIKCNLIFPHEIEIYAKGRLKKYHKCQCPKCGNKFTEIWKVNR